jgi:hypothetical protein
MTINGVGMTSGENLLPHLRWELGAVMSRVRPDDLSATEITALLAILMPAHSRVIDRTVAEVSSAT